MLLDLRLLQDKQVAVVATCAFGQLLLVSQLWLFLSGKNLTTMVHTLEIECCSMLFEDHP